MGVAVYPRLGELLHERRLTVDELGQQIEARFGMTVDPKVLQRLTHASPVQRADLQVAGATAAVLGVGLDQLFTVEATPVNLEEPESLLSAEQDRRMTELFDRRDRAGLTDAEQAELENLVDQWGHNLHERNVRELAAKRGVSVEEMQRELDADLAKALEWWRAIEADPKQRRALVAEARRRNSRRQLRTRVGSVCAS